MSAPPAQSHRDEDQSARELQGIVSRIEEQMEQMPNFRPHVGEVNATTVEAIGLLIKKLHEIEVFNFADVEELNGMPLHRKCAMLYGIIARRKALKRILDALEESNKSHIIKLMEGWLPRQDLPQSPTTPVPHVQLQMKKPTSKNDKLAKLDGTGSVVSNYVRKVYAVNKDHYRGLALIVNVEHYPSVEDHRKGSKADVKRLEKVLNDCNIAWLVVEDPILQSSKTATDGRHVLSEVITHFQKQFGDQEWNADCCFVFVMAHGKDGSNDCIVLSDGGIFSVWTELVEKFSDNAHKIRRLKEIPKIFVFNYCRGEKVMGPSIDAYSGLNPSINHVIPSSPEWTDMLICYATVQGYGAVREQGGTWFIQILCDAMERYADKYDFLTILDIVSDAIKIVEVKNEDNKVWKQMSAYYNIGFDKRFYLKTKQSKP